MFMAFAYVSGVLILYYIYQQVVIEQSTPYVVLDRVDLLYFGKGSKGAILI